MSTLPYPVDQQPHLPIQWTKQLGNWLNAPEESSTEPGEPHEDLLSKFLTRIEEGPDQFVWPDEAIAWGRAPVYEVNNQ